MIIVLVIKANIAISQTVYYPVNNSSVYELIDELANLGVVEINTAIKPYSRKVIAEKLDEALKSSDLLSQRQLKEVHFYLKDFSKELAIDTARFEKRRDLFYFRNDRFNFTVNPILGGEAWYNENDFVYHRWVGLDGFGSIDNFSFYANIRENRDSWALRDPSYRNQLTGANYKFEGQAGEFSEMRGGVTYNWNWGTIGLIKDHLVWGNNNNGANIFSDKSPSFTQIKLHVQPVNWIELNYFHAWLASGIIDSARTYFAGNRNRRVLRPKYMAANMITVRPLKKLNISIGNSIVYSDIGLNPVYLIPLFFYKSIDHTVSSGVGNAGGQNAQMYFDISSRQIKNLHLFASVYIDEIAFGRYWDKNAHSNFISFKSGAQYIPPFMKDITVSAEYTRTNPIVYEHFVNTITLTSNHYNFGHYLRDNVHEVYFSLYYRPVSKLRAGLEWVFAEAGPDYPYIGTGNSGLGLPFVEEVKWKSVTTRVSIRYQWINDVFVFADLEYRNVEGDLAPIHTHPMFLGQTNTIHAGIYIGMW